MLAVHIVTPLITLASPLIGCLVTLTLERERRGEGGGPSASQSRANTSSISQDKNDEKL